MLLTDLPRINRYIMECKYICSNDRNTEYLELIDTLWNVNDYLLHISERAERELIDTLWNVNDNIKRQDRKSIEN